MKSRLTALAIAGALLATACAEAPVIPSGLQSVQSDVAMSATGQHIVSFKKDEVPADFAAAVAALGGSVDAAYAGAGLAVVSGLSAEAVSSLATLSTVDQIGPNDVFQILDPSDEVAAESVTDEPASPTNPTTATRYPRQWNMRQIGANVAWAAGKLGSSSVKVAILDTGIDYLYPDLVGRVDLANSKSFVATDDALVASLFPTRHPSTDLHYHGTHVAATVSSNSTIVAGVTTQTTLMAVKVLNVNGSGATDWILGGIMYAADHGANVISMSLGNRNLPFSMHLKPNKDFFNKVVDRAFKYAHSKGVTIVVAAGNESQNLDVKQTFKPYCGAMHVICVSATGPTAGGTNGPWVNPDAFASYSNYGYNLVNVAAPGGNVGGTVWSACSTSSLVQPVCRTGIFILGLNGTSMATPHVSGLAALIIAEKGGSAPPGLVRSTIEGTADDLGTPGEDAQYGRGRINVARALGLQ